MNDEQKMVDDEQITKKIYNNDKIEISKNTLKIISIGILTILIIFFIISIIIIKIKNNKIKLILLEIEQNQKYEQYFLFNDTIKKAFKNTTNKNNDNYFFYERQDQINYCNNYGILVYDYYTNCKINKWTDNIGDYIQSLAALQFLPKNCFPYFIDRESVRFYHGPKVKLIMNGFFTLTIGNNEVTQQINPLYISYHINNKIKIKQDTIQNLIKFQPIGCRDISTQIELEKHGIKAYFSGCITLTLDIDYSVKDSERRNEIIFIDYQLGEYEKADNYLKLLKNYNFENATYITHHFNLSKNHLERFQIAKELLDKYARAKLVVTTRLHGALPCLALHTPVIFISKFYDYKRFPGLYDLLNTIGNNKNGIFEIRVNLDEKGFVYNSDKYLEYANKIKEKLKYFKYF